jgi:serine/threonine protein kinase
MGHPNIIETHYLMNRKGTEFLVEERLPVLLADTRTPSGVHEAANLLYDIASALNYLHSQLRLVHGDIKPDNIGKKGEDYILLDFGICRPIVKFRGGTAATGSLRTRAPELLKENRYVFPEKADVWALGATVFNGLAGRFPLFNKGEVPPRISTLEARARFEKKLLRRVHEEWDQRVDLVQVPDPLRKLLGRTLEQDPNLRCTADDILVQAERDLAAFIRHRSGAGRFSPLDELNQLLLYLPQDISLECMPITEKQALQSRLEWLRDTQSVSEEQRMQIVTLLRRVT